ncbi:DNA topoisomerase, partial [Thiolapillus sp.]
IAFHEITEKAVKASLAEAGDIDMGLVAAQEGRRVMDRLVGYRVSGPLSDRLQQRASAGRVQTPALRLVVDRENEIRAFVPTDYFEVVATFDAETGRWEAKWDSKPYLKAGQDYFQDEAFANSVATLREFTVQDISTKPVTRKPPPPFISSTLIQAASSQLKIKPKKAMQLAQELFEAALITYHRTDTPNLSDEAVGMVWDWLRQNGKDNYIPPAANKWKAKGGAQEAHEAIRPTDFSNREANNVSSDAARLYDLIWRRAVASQMKPACFDETSIHLRSTQTTNDGRQQDFHAKGRVMTFNGWMALGADNKQSQQLPSLSSGAVITSSDTVVKAKRTQPPKRYTEATLVKKLEDSEIGRPSTYASIMETLTSRHYVREHKEGKGKQVYLAPTPLGEKIIAALAGGFSFADYEFTRQVEAHLDKIAAGEERYIDVVTRINDTLDNELGKMPTPEGVEQHECPECGKPLRLRNGKRGAFWGCTGYPDCKYTAPDDGGKPGQRAPEPKPASDKTYDCPVCSKPLRLRNGQRGAFWGCTGYPDCNYLVDDNQGVPALPDKIYPCPECSKPMRR